MDAKQAKEILDKIVGAVFGYQNPLTLEQAMQKFAFDLNLPQQVYDSTTGEITWANSINPSRFITMDNSLKHAGIDEWILPKRELNSIEDILAAWAETNYTTVERQIESTGVAESDSVNNSENIYRSALIRRCKNILFSRGCADSEFLVASSESQTSAFSIRVEDSQLVSNSFEVVWSAKISNSFFIQDCYDMSDCMFCSHTAGKQYCIANMQFEKEEYERIKLEVIRWIFAN
ncbi:hypothetical protein KC952_02420 [Candidatus Saccharibacteria bacterium]|jgi:hypothetical protein|nr:hypothetical protein [Candidatus Saccharibacteria bacterium]